MTEIQSLLRNRVSVVWLFLIAATAISWALGSNHGIDHRSASVVILVVAFAKVRFVGIYFMELKEAPLPLRGFFEAYCIAICTLVTCMFLFT